MDATALQDLLDKQAICELSYTYSRACDRLDRDLLTSVYWPDGSDDHGIFKGSAPDYVDWVMNLLSGWVSTHHENGNILIELDGDDAWGEVGWTGFYTFTVDGQLTDQLAVGRYLDHYQRRNGEWRILHRSCLSDWNRMAPVEANWRDARQEDPLRGKRKPDDLLYDLRRIRIMGEVTTDKRGT